MSDSFPGLLWSLHSGKVPPIASGTARSASCHPHRALLRARRTCRFRLPCKMFPYTSKPLLPDNLYLIQGDSVLQHLFSSAALRLLFSSSSLPLFGQVPADLTRISPLLMLAYATPTAVFALISLPPMVAHHLTTTRSTLHQQTVMATKIEIRVHI